MPKGGKSTSKLSLSKRRERAFILFARGYTNSDVAKDITVAPDTVAKYRKLYESRIHAQAAANPNFLREVVENTVRTLEELDQIRADAWAHMKSRKEVRHHTCPHCEEEFVERETIEISDSTRAQYQRILLSAQDQRAKLMGLLGIKHEVVVSIMQVKVVQDKLLEFMGGSLCAADRIKLENFLTQPELMEYMQGMPGMQAIETSALEMAEI